MSGPSVLDDSNISAYEYTSGAAARYAATSEGWRQHPADRDVYVRGVRRIRLTQIDPRRWCWTTPEETP